MPTRIDGALRRLGTVVPPKTKNLINEVFQAIADDPEACKEIMNEVRMNTMRNGALGGVREIILEILRNGT